MKAYKKLQTRYHEKVKAKWRAKIKCAVCSILVLFLVASFIGLVIGLSLGLERHTKCRKDYQHYCDTGCTDVRTDPLNCGDCGHTCDTNAGAVCLSRHCEFCTFNCSADNDFCTIEPCNSTAGCTIFDCANDGNPCTINPCNSTAGGCTPLDCANDGDYCTVGPCNSNAGGCAPRDCDLLGDPCLTNPCTNGNCSYQCPGLQLNFPSTNYSTTVTGFTGIVPLGSSTARLTSVPNIDNVTVSFSPLLGGDVLTVTGTDANINVAFAGQTLTMTAIPSNGLAASNFQTLLRDVRYSCNNPGPGVRNVVFTYQVTNKKPRSLPSAVVATVTLNIP